MHKGQGLCLNPSPAQWKVGKNSPVLSVLLLSVDPETIFPHPFSWCRPMTWDALSATKFSDGNSIAASRHIHFWTCFRKKWQYVLIWSNNKIESRVILLWVFSFIALFAVSSYDFNYMPQKQEILGEESDQAIRCCYGCRHKLTCMRKTKLVTTSKKKRGGGASSFLEDTALRIIIIITMSQCMVSLHCRM